MKKLISILAIIIVSALLICACGKSKENNSAATSADQTSQAEQTSAASSDTTASQVIDTAIVGSWKEVLFDSGFTFNADGTGSDTFWDLTFTYSCENGEILIVYDTDLYGASKYTYSISGDTLSMTRIDEEETSTFTYSRVTEQPATESTPSESEPDEEEEAA